MLDLYEHNETAYLAAQSLMEQTGKAAVIHPTGTGKSFIGFRLCADHPDKVICWLSPSAYIFRTQLENLAAAADGWTPDNIRFYTYAKLLCLDEEELAAIRPDFILLDEFHRCGARMWGQGVERLLRHYPTVPLLGLSATNIRYLDNQRDMADELFDGSIASEMTLGEAIVRGILHPPKYVLSIFSYQKELDAYEARIRNVRSRAARDACERYLEELRRKLENAEGLDEIFQKHMTDKTGKYLVFCANKEHMDEMMGHLEWFSRVDAHPHVYSLYSGDPDSDRSFAAFKADDDSSHLRLLYCIDALNEGIHVEDVSGVILLRPTVSPIIYKQQIGRALSASKKTDAVIFDVVLNIENLYSIGAIEEEMEAATTYYRSAGEGASIVNEHFRVIDEVRDCRDLFEKLGETLTASWDRMYEKAASYYEQNGNLEVAAHYVTEEGYSLGSWIFNQRNIRSGRLCGTLTKDQIRRLDAIGMVWDSSSDRNWSRNYAAAKRYFETHGDLNVPARYVTEDQVALGAWLCSLRTWEKAGVHRKYLTQERREQLNAVGMIWDGLNALWENNFAAARAYYEEHGTLDPASSYVTPDGIRLGAWVGRLRTLREGRGKGTPLTKEQIDRLDAIGMVWNGRSGTRWEKSFCAAEQYAKENGNLLVPAAFETADGVRLGSWIQRQRRAFREGKLSGERIKRLEEIGMIWEVICPVERRRAG